MSLDPIATLAELIAIPSVNPMGRPVSGPEYFETRLTAHLEQLFARLGLTSRRQTVEPGRDNIFCQLPGRGDQLLLFEVHQDTVPVAGMTIAPFEPTIREGRIYGRGACDVKGGMAAMLAAVARLADERPANLPTIVLACTINEEFGFTGVTRLVDLWTREGILPRRPDAAIVAEPTELHLVVAHKGAVRWQCHTHGRAAHSSQPQQGDNAIYQAGRVALAVEKFQREVAPTLGEHPLCGGATTAVTMIAGGLSVNTIPDRCTLEIERRLLPDEDPQVEYERLTAFLNAHAGPEDHLEHAPPYGSSPGLSQQHNGPLAERLLSILHKSEPDRRLIGVPYGTDASILAAAGVPTVVFGPGSIDQAHTADEFLELDQLTRASEVYYRFALSALD